MENVEKFIRERQGNNPDGSPCYINRLSSQWLSTQTIDELKVLLVSTNGKDYRNVLTEYMRRRIKPEFRT